MRSAAQFVRLQVPKNRSRAVALCAVLSPPHLGQGTFATQSTITCPKLRIPGTLNENICPTFIYRSTPSMACENL